MQKYISAAERRKKADRQGYKILVGCGAVVAVGLAAFMATRPPARDKATGCITGSLPLLQHVVIADLSDPRSEANRSLLTVALDDLVSRMNSDERLTVLTFDGTASSDPVIAFDGCKPPEGKSVSALWANPALVDRAYKKTFGDPLKAVFESVAGGGEARVTELASYLGNIASRFTYAKQAEHFDISVWSNFAENSAEGTFVGKGKKFTKETFAAYFAQRVGERLKGVSLDLRVVPTGAANAALGARIKDAWEFALKSSGVTYTWKNL